MCNYIQYNIYIYNIIYTIYYNIYYIQYNIYASRYNCYNTIHTKQYMSCICMTYSGMYNCTWTVYTYSSWFSEKKSYKFPIRNIMQIFKFLFPKLVLINNYWYWMRLFLNQELSRSKSVLSADIIQRLRPW